MSRIAIVTDSTANLHPEFIKYYNIRVLPLKIHWGEETLRDGVDITPSEFYERLGKSADIPTTSQPSIQEFTQVFEELAPHCVGIIAPLISSGISGTVDSALSAQSEFSAVPVEIVDSFSTAAGLALVVIAASRAVDDGKSFAEINQITVNAARHVQLFFMVDTLEYLHKGGRIGGASRFFGSALGIKPILYLDESGKIDALERVRTKQKALSRLIELAANRAAGRPAHVGILHADAYNLAVEFRQQIKDHIDCLQLDIYELSPVIGTHVGPGAIGVAIYPEEE
jgi:DegV family protein with EDD domain